MKLGVEVNTCSSNTWEVEAEDQKVKVTFSYISTVRSA